MIKRKINSGTRFGTMILDHLIMTVIAMIFFIPSILSMLKNAFTVSHDQMTSDVFGGLSWLGLIGLAVYFCKDCINGRSISKRILKLQIVDNLTGQVASPIKCLIRNLFIVIWPLEVIVALINPSRRLGDRVAGTKLIMIDSALEQPKFKIGQILISLILAYGFIFLLALPFYKMQSTLSEQKIPYIESSFNQQFSQSIEKLFTDSLGKNFKADVRYYDKIENQDLKYISVILLISDNYLQNETDFKQLKLVTTRLLYTKIPAKTVVGQIKYVYKTSTSMVSRSIRLDWRLMD